MTLLLTIGLLGQAPTPGPKIPNESAARLEFMKKSKDHESQNHGKLQAASRAIQGPALSSR